MILNWFLLLLTAFIAYVSGSVSTRRVASRYVFKRDLTKLGRGNTWLSNFRRLFGYLGFAKLGLVEIVKDLLPLLIGFRGRPDIGRIFAGYCLMLGRLWPVFNRFKGGHGCVALILIGLLIEPSIGITPLSRRLRCTRNVLESIRRQEVSQSIFQILKKYSISFPGRTERKTLRYG